MLTREGKKILMERSSGQLVPWAAEVGVLREKTGFQPRDRGSALKEPARSVSSPSRVAGLPIQNNAALA